jgi:hypothetical protein
MLDWTVRGSSRVRSTTRRAAAHNVATFAVLLPIISLTGCTSGQSAQAEQAPPTAAPTEAPAYQIQVQVQAIEVGGERQQVLRAVFRSRDGRPVSGGQMQAVVNYPTGPQTFTSEQTTFQDGRADLAVPESPPGRPALARGTQVRVEVLMKYQGQEYRANSGFSTR